MASTDASGGGQVPLAGRQKLPDAVYDWLKAQIMDGELPPSARVNLDEIARRLSVSQSPVREALARLAAEGLVVHEPYRGYSTTPLMSRGQFEELFDFRLLIEPWAAGRAAERCSAADAAALEAELATCVEVAAGSSFSAYGGVIAHDGRFHDLILGLAGNGHLRQALSHSHFPLHMHRLHYKKSIGASAFAEHQRITTAIAQRDPDWAAAAMRRHLEGTRNRWLPVFDEWGGAGIVDADPAGAHAASADPVDAAAGGAAAGGAEADR
ncbi:GntR family transcriptional regulator [Rugosimonospora acidiphila]|uniref:GntR family transcriptional regulator n=1 Tax=Rugosimonospora acidiphila TaxID=556531 RepID=A0ABP9RLY1_9ACTN